MSTQTTHTTPAPVPSQSDKNISSIKQYIDITINSSLMNEFSKIISSGFSVKNICKMLLILSIDEMRQFMVYFMKELSKYININTIYEIFNLFKFVLRKKQKYIEDSQDMDMKYVENHVIVNIIYNNQIIDSLMNYIMKNKETSNYQVNNIHEYNIKDLDNIEIISNFDDIKIIYDDILITINNALTIKHININNKLNVISCDTRKEKYDDLNAKCICDLVPPYHRDIVKRIHNYIDNIKQFDDKMVRELDKNYIVSNYYYCSLYSNLNGVKIPNLYEKYKSFKYNDLFINTEILFILSITMNSDFPICKKLNIYGNTYMCDIYSPCYIDASSIIPLEDKKQEKGSLINSLKDEIKNEIKKLKITPTDNDNDDNNKITPTPNVINVKISPFSKDTILTKEYINDKFNEFVKNNIQVKNKNSKNVKTYIVKLTQKEVINVIDNPKYIEFMDKINLLDKDDKEKEIINSRLPPKTINNITYIKTINEELISERYKSFKNLFLRKKDKEYLLSVLNQFKSNKDIFVSLDLQYKLNILLSGNMGCGKSTSIVAIASFLERDIYCLNLNNIETNEELKLLFDHVNKNCKGIVVIEDIDAQTDIVKSRKHKNDEESLTKTMDSIKDKLTLDFFLNYLQGSLTKDDSVFIMTTQFKADLDDALIRPMRMDCMIDFKLCDKYQISDIFKQFINRDIDQNILNCIEEDKWSPADIINIIRNYVNNSEISDNEIMKNFIKQ